MKIALCLSGQPRHFEKGFQQFKQHLLSKYDVDVFLHCWHEPGNKEPKWNTVFSKNLNQEGTDKTILDLYNPKKYLIEPQIEELSYRPYNTYKQVPNAPVHIQFSMFYSIKKSNDLKKEYEEENGFKYDVVIRSRFDCGILDDLYFPEDKTKAYFVDVLKFPGVFCDWLFFGNSELMDTICDAYNYMTEYHDKGIRLCGENILTHHLEYNNIEKCGLPISTFLIRDDEFSDRSYYGKMYEK